MFLPSLSLQCHAAYIYSFVWWPTGQEAQLYVPRLLSVMASCQPARHCFSQVWSSVALHVLLPWAAQMLSLLDAPQGEALLPPLQVGRGHNIEQLVPLCGKLVACMYRLAYAGKLVVRLHLWPSC